MDSENKILVGFQYSIRANYVFSKPLFINRNPVSKTPNLNSLANLKDNTTKGKMSKQSARKLQNACNWLIVSSLDKKIFSAKALKSSFYKISFITLTIPPQGNEQIKASAIKKILNSYLTYHRIYSNLNNYVWKLEEHKDGRIHVHLLTDTFIWHKKIRDSWNKILEKNGLLTNHYKKYGNLNPNSTDVRAVKKAKNITAYIAKYMSKENKENEEFTGRVWSCSVKISKALNNTITIDIDQITLENRKLFNSSIEWKSIFTKDAFGNDQWHLGDMFFMKARDWIKLKGTQIFECFKQTVIFLRSNNQLKLEI